MPIFNRASFIATGLMLGVSMLAGSPAQANDVFPSKPIRLVLGFSAGGGTDVLARTLAQKMGETLGRPVIVDNKPGANGNIAGEAVAKAPADGYTLLYNTSSIILSPALYERLPYDVNKDLVPVGLAANQPLVLVAAPNAPVKNIQDVVSTLKAHPETLNYGSAGNGNITHLSMLMFQQAIGAHGMHVPYRGESLALTDLMSGQIQLYMGTTAGVTSMIKDKRVRAMAVGSLKRLPSLPEIPTFDETAAKGLELGSWSGIMAPAGTSPEVINKLNAALQKALADKDVQARFASQSAEIKGGTAQEYGVFLKSELMRWAKIIKAANVRLD